MIGEALNIVSVIFSFLAIFGTLYLLQKLTIGFLPIFKKILYKSLSLGDIIFISTTLFIIHNYIDFYRPY